MSENSYSIGTKLNLVPCTSLWEQAHTKGRSGATFEVVAQVDDGTGMARMTLRDLDSGEIAFWGIDPHLFTPVH
ncbi:hypothetical protein ACIPCF_19655 (plasmid) [Paracoccus marcusii]|uniref:hypothetical protein n=1 Tax=Paracoccus marcusii TaxID=59779 RepID=UPI0038BB9464